MSSIRELKEKINDVFPDPQREVLLDFADVLDSTVKVSDFNELKSIVADLAKSQKELAEAQKRTEERLNSLTIRVEELAQAQKRTEQGVRELAEAQKRTEKRLEELAEAQKRTETSLAKLSEEHEKTRRHLASLTHTVGYFLENEAFKYLPKLLNKDFDLDTVGDLKRDYLEIRKNIYEEINIIGKGRRHGKECTIIGEVKTQLSVADINQFVKKVKKVEKLLSGEKIFVLVTHQAHPTVRKYAAEKQL
ncbi:MAG: hypothetical protein QXO63_01565 [Thermoplasmatales archaeon]